MKKILFKTLTLITLTFFITSCGDDDTEPVTNASSDTTEINAEITFTTMKISGKVASNDGNEITSHGFCWSLSPKPTINDNKVTQIEPVFSSVLSNLTLNTTYYFRVFATTNAGTTYSKEQSLKTLSLGNTIWNFTVKDHSGNNVLATVNFNEDLTTRYEEKGCSGCYIAHGTWSTEGNKLNYIGENDDPAKSRHVFSGIIINKVMQGTYKHETEPDGTWSAVLQ